LASHQKRIQSHQALCQSAYGGTLTYPKTVVKKTVDDWVDEAVGHGEPVHAVVECNEEASLSCRLVVGEFRIEVDNEHKRVQWQPTYGEQNHDYHQHLYHLFTRQSINQSYF